MTKFFSVSCDKCGEAYETTKRTLPFVCDSCEEAMEFLNAISPRIVSACTDTSCTGIAGGECDSGSVEATTDLIAALEDDNANAQKQIAFLEAREQALYASTVTQNRAIENMAGKISQLIDDKNRIKQVLADLTVSAIDFVEESLTQVAELTEKLQQADAELEARAADTAHARRLLTASRQRGVELYDAIDKAEARGLWARIVNAPIV